MKKKIFVLMVILMVASMLVSCNSCMRSSAEPVTKQTYDQLDTATANPLVPISQSLDKQTTSTQIDTMYLRLEETETTIISQQKQIDSLLASRMKNKK